MKLAMYKGPADGLAHKLGHAAVCVFTLSRYSHVELVIGQTCYSSSIRDGGVRSKAIDFTSGHWDLVDVPPNFDEVAALRWFQDHAGQKYDYAGVARFLLPFLPQHKDQWFCSEAVAAALGLDEASSYTPQDLVDLMEEMF